VSTTAQTSGLNSNSSSYDNTDSGSTTGKAASIMNGNGDSRRTPEVPVEMIVGITVGVGVVILSVAGVAAWVVKKKKAVVSPEVRCNSDMSSKGVQLQL
jgi:hypothetical protein